VESFSLAKLLQITTSAAEDYVVVGTLDINQGLVLPGEIIGDYPQVFPFPRVLLVVVCN
jgi:hypothetical protein